MKSRNLFLCWFINIFLALPVLGQMGKFMSVPYEQNGLWGYMNFNQKVIHGPKWLKAYPTYDLRGLVKTQTGKFGYVDTTGTIVIKPKFEKAANFYRGYAKVSNKKKNYLIDTNGEQPNGIAGYCGNGLNQHYWREGERNRNGALFYKKGDKFGLKYTRVEKISDKRNLTIEDSTVALFDTLFFTMNQTLVIKKDNKYAVHYYQFYYSNEEDIITKLAFKYDSLKYFPSIFYPAFNHRIIGAKQGEFWTYLDFAPFEIKEIFPPKFKKITSMERGFALVTMPNGRKGYVHESGKEFFHPAYIPGHLDPCQANIDTAQLLLKGRSYINKVKKNFCHQAIIDILVDDKRKNKEINDSIYIERLCQLTELERIKRPWKAIAYTEELVDAADKYIKIWEASGRSKSQNGPYKFVMKIAMARGRLIQLKAKEGMLTEVIPDIKALSELLFDKNVLWCAVGEFIDPIYFDFLKLIENEDETSLGITKEYLFTDFKSSTLHKIVRRMEVETLIYLENKYGKENLWQALENGIQQLKIKEATYPKGHYQVFVPAFGEEIPVYFEALNEKLDANFNDAEMRKIILSMYQQRLRKTFLYWLMRGNAGGGGVNGGITEKNKSTQQ